MSPDRVLFELDPAGIARVCLNRPESHNALDVETFEALRAVASSLARDRSVRAVVLHGAGESFCSGVDTANIAAESGDLVELLRRRGGHPANDFQRVAYDWSLVSAPVIAAIHGHCLGAGLQIALGADIRIVAPDARLSIREVRWGLIPDMAISYTLPPHVRMDVAKELTFTGRVVDGRQAVALGLASRVAADPLEEAVVLAGEIASQSPDAVQAAKRLYNETWTADAATGMRRESELEISLLGKPNQLAAIRAAVTGEAATYLDPEPAGY